MPGLTIATDAAHPAPAAQAPEPASTSTNPRRASGTSARTSSPPRPPVSPITPPLAATQLPGPDPPPAVPDFSRGRPTFTHTTQVDQHQLQQSAPPPPPLAPAAPIDFDANPDVLALKSAISILQLQRARAAADIQQLSRAKAAALADPEGFVADLEAGRVQVGGGGGDSLFGRGVGGQVAEDDDDDDSDEDDEEEEEEDKGEVVGPQESTTDSRTTTGASARSSDGDVTMGDDTSTETMSKAQTKPSKAKPKKKKQSTTTTTQPPAWQKLPKPQNVVRCPPINWAQYGVVGESLDKLHAEQLAAPTPGAPLVLGSGGTYEFTAGSSEQATTTTPSSGAEPRRLVGIAAPYNPLRDKIDKKGKGGRR